MRIGLLAGADANPYASTMLVRLIRQDDRPACIILAEEPRLRRLAAHIRLAGLGPTLRKVSGQWTGVLPDRDARHYLRQYASRENLLDWDSPLSILTAKNDLPLVRVQSLLDEEAARYVEDNQLDVLVNCAGVIFKSRLLQAPRIGMLNAHMARLPRFRGMNVLEWSVWFGEQPGVTVHFVTPGIDRGDVLCFREIPIASDDTIASLRARSYEFMVESVADCIARLREGRADRTPQRPEDGRQYFVMHPRLLRITESRLERLKRVQEGAS